MLETDCVLFCVCPRLCSCALCCTHRQQRRARQWCWGAGQSQGIPTAPLVLLGHPALLHLYRWPSHMLVPSLSFPFHLLLSCCNTHLFLPPLKDAPMLHTLTLNLACNNMGNSGAQALAGLRDAKVPHLHHLGCWAVPGGDPCSPLFSHFRGRLTISGPCCGPSWIIEKGSSGQGAPQPVHSLIR